MLKFLASEIHKRLELLQKVSRAVFFSGMVTALFCGVAACIVACFLLFIGTDFFLHAVLTQLIYGAVRIPTLAVLIVFVTELNVCLKGR